jgi:hypothetical protein
MKGMMKQATLPAIVALIAFAVGTAHGQAQHQQPHTFGRPGSKPAVSSSCQRKPMDTTPWGRTWLAGGKQATSQGFTVEQAINKCGTQRTTRIIRCAEKAIAAGAPVIAEKADHGAGKPGDETGAAAYAAWNTSFVSCLAGVKGGAR